MARPIHLAPDYADWTKSQLIERLNTLGRQIDDREAVGAGFSRLAAIVESSADAIVAMMVDGLITDWNGTAESILGYTAEEAIGEPISLIVPERQWDEVLRECETAKQGKRVHTLETVHRRKDGVLIDISVTISPIRDAAGNVVGLSAIKRDISERKRIDAALNESEQRFRDIAETASDWIWETGPDLRFTWVSARAEELYGRRVQDFLGKAIDELEFPDDDHDEWRRHLEVLRAHRPFRNLSIRRTDPQGRQHHFVIIGKPLFGANGEFLGYRGTGSDITEQKRREESLRASEERFKDIVETMSDWIWEMDADLRFCWLSPRFEEIRGRPAAFYIGKTVEELGTSLEDQTVWKQNLEDLRSHRPFRNVPNVMKMPDGKLQHFEFGGNPIFDSGGKFQGYRGTGSDVTQRVEMEEKLRQFQKMEAVGQLTGGVAHDFNNLLAIILGNAELLKDHSGNDGTLVENVIQAAIRGGELTQQLLSFARQQQLHPRVIDLNALVTGLEMLLGRTLGEKITVRAETTGEPWCVEVDPSQLESAVLNLAINARDAMVDGGEVVIETANITAAELPVGETAGVAPGDYVMLTVTDTGVGMTADVLEHAFEPFYSTKEIGQGSGLGLSMVYGFANQSHGYVTIDTEIGRGTTVKLLLPRAWKPDRLSEQEPVADELPGRGETVLLVEDEAGVRTLTAALLGQLGYAVIEAHDGATAIATLESAARVDLLLTDVVLPGAMSGPKIAEEARRLRIDIKTLLMSGYPDQVLRYHGRSTDSAQLLAKPFPLKVLAQKVRNALDSPSIGA